MTHSSQTRCRINKILRFNGFPVNHVDVADDYDPEDVIVAISMNFIP